MISIVYQDDAMVAVNKPAGMLVHRSAIDRHETVFLMQTLRNQLGQLVYPVHRLDRPTSGIMLFALNPETAQLLSAQFEQRTVQKHYLAIVRGWTEDKGNINYPLVEQWDKTTDARTNPQKAAQSAQTDYCTLARCELPFVSQARFATSRYSLLSLQPHTGRKHQLRRHLKHIFHPIIGDTTHGDLNQNKAVFAYCGVSRLWLHAHRLHFMHPHHQKTMQLTASVGEEWQQMCIKMALN